MKSIQTLSLMVNYFFIQRIWIKLNKIFLFTQSVNMLVYYQFTVLKRIYIHIDLKVLEIWRSAICQIFIMKKKLTSVFHNFHVMKWVLRVECKSDYCKNQYSGKYTDLFCYIGYNLDKKE